MIVTLAKPASLTVITHSRIFEMVFRRALIRKEAVEY